MENVWSCGLSAGLKKIFSHRSATDLGRKNFFLPKVDNGLVQKKTLFFRWFAQKSIHKFSLRWSALSAGLKKIFSQRSTTDLGRKNFFLPQISLICAEDLQWIDSALICVISGISNFSFGDWCGFCAENFFLPADHLGFAQKTSQRIFGVQKGNLKTDHRIKFLPIVIILGR